MSAKEELLPLLARVRKPFITIVLLYIAVVLFFRETLTFTFFQDDYFFLSQLRRIGLRDLILGTPVIPPYFRPLATNWLPWLNDKIWGQSPAGFYLQLYLVVALLFYYLHALLRRLLGDDNWMAWFGTALYAFSRVWPYNMGWPVTANIELIAPMGFVASIHYFLRYIDTGLTRHQVACLVFLFAGMTSKEYVYATPGVFALAYVLLARGRVPSFVRALAPSCCLVVVWTAYALVRIPSVWRTGSGSVRPGFAARALYGAFEYVLPFPLTPPAGGILLSAAVVLAAVLARMRAPKEFLRTAAVMALIALIPALPIALVPYPAEYYSTAPGIGVAMLVTLWVYGAVLLLRRLPFWDPGLRLTLGVLMVGYLAAECRASVAARPAWATIANQPLTKRLLTSMNYWLSAPRYRGAEVALIGMSEHQAWCLGRMSAFAYLYPGVTVRRFQSAPSEADDAAPRLVLYVSERGFADTSPLPVAADADHAKAVFAQGKYAEALALYEKLIRSDPESAEAQYHYAFCLHMAGRLAEAEAPYTRALQLDPLMDRLVRYNRGAVYLYTGRIGLAEEDLKRALVMDPANPGVRVYWDELLKRKAAAQ